MRARERVCERERERKKRKRERERERARQRELYVDRKNLPPRGGFLFDMSRIEEAGGIRQLKKNTTTRGGVFKGQSSFFCPFIFQ